MFGLLRRGAAFAAITATAAVGRWPVAASDVKGDRADLVHGKQLFVQRCGACHALARAGTRGTVGPDLDDAFAQSLDDGFERRRRQRRREASRSSIRAAPARCPRSSSPARARPTSPPTWRPPPRSRARTPARSRPPSDRPRREPASAAGRQTRDRRQPRRPARLRGQQRDGAAPARSRSTRETPPRIAARHRAAGGHRRQSARRGRGRLQRRRLERLGRPETRQIHVLLHRCPATARAACRAR